jgi:hypothetical protein
MFNWLYLVVVTAVMDHSLYLNGFSTASFEVTWECQWKNQPVVVAGENGPVEKVFFRGHFFSQEFGHSEF